MFFHTELMSSLESVPGWQSETEYDSCARTDYRGRCQGGTRRVMTRHTESKWVMKHVDVTDGACAKGAFYRLEKGNDYFFNFVFVRNGECLLTCRHLQRTPGDSSRFDGCNELSTEGAEAELGREKEAAERRRQRQWEVGGRVSHGTPSGDLSASTSMDDMIERQVSVEFDAAYRITPHWALGVDIQYGFGSQPSSRGGKCPWSADSCRIASTWLGLQLNYHANPRGAVDPWLGIATGIESLVIHEPKTDNRRDLQGWGMVKMQIGLDIPLTRGFAVGPFGAISVSRYTHASCEGQACVAHGGVQNPAMHEWIFLGLRGAFVL